MLKVRQQELDIESAEIHNRQLEVELTSSKLDLAERMLEVFDPNHAMSHRRRQQLMFQVIGGIDQLSKTSMEFKAIGPSPRDEIRLARQ